MSVLLSSGQVKAGDVGVAAAETDVDVVVVMVLARVAELEAAVA